MKAAKKKKTVTSSARSKRSAPAPAAPLKLSDDERGQVAEFNDRRKTRTRLKPSKVTDGDTTVIAWDHENQALAEIYFANVLQSDDIAFSRGVRLQLAKIVTGPGGMVHDKDLDFAAATLRAIEPRDPVEALLAAQMTAVHNATMMLGSLASASETVPQTETFTRLLAKLARTFTAQVEALKKHRSTGEQTIRVQRVTVNDGGQAIVGNVKNGGRGADENTTQPHEPDAG